MDRHRDWPGCDWCGGRHWVDGVGFRGMGRQALVLGRWGMIAALFVEKDGCYFGLDGVDPWDKTRDARKYKGPWPIVAHPPCQLWGSLAHVNYSRWGGEHNMPGNDGLCFFNALSKLKKYYGVLEHPAKTRAWCKYGLKNPEKYKWTQCEKTKIWTCEVWQSAYGHRANKATWLAYHGKRPPYDLNWDRPIGSHQIGFHDQRGKSRNKPTLSKKEANATPTAFRDELIRLAHWSTGEGGA